MVKEETQTADEAYPPQERTDTIIDDDKDASGTGIGTGTSTAANEDSNLPSEEVKLAIDAVVKSIQDHGRIDDPVEPPARNAPKNFTLKNRDDDENISFLPINSKSILSRLFDPDRKQKPQLWEHIKLVAPGPADQPPPGHIKWRSKDAVSAYCLKCRKQFTYTKGTSKTVSRHMQAYHGLILKEDKEETKRPGGVMVANAPPPIKKRKFDLSPQVLLLHWIVSSFQPWSIVESEGIQDFVSCLSNSLVMPTTQEIIQLATDNVERVKWEIRHRLKECDHYSLVCQMFQHHLHQWYTSVTITFCTPTFELQSACLGVLTGKCNNETLGTLLMEYSLSWNKITHVTITGVPDKLDIGWTVSSNLCVLYHMDEILQRACTNNEAIVSLYSPDVLQTTAKFTQRIYNVTLRMAEESGDDIHQTILSALASIFKPFFDAYMTLSGDLHPTVGLTVPVFRRIRDVLANIPIEEVTKGNQEASIVMEGFYKDLSNTFQHAFRDLLSEGGANAPIWTIPTDPRLIHMGGLSEKEKLTVTQTLIDMVAGKKLASAERQGMNSLDANNMKGTGMKSEPSTMGGIFWGDDPGGTEQASNQIEAAAAHAQANLDRYFTTVKSQRRIEDPLAWWKANYDDFPELGDIARTWFGAKAVGPATDKRSQYSDEKIELMVFLHDNAKLLLCT